MFLFQTSNSNYLFGYVSETEAILFFGVCLIILTIVIRWVLKKYEATQNSENKVKESVKR